MNSQKENVKAIEVINYLKSRRNAKEFLKKLGIDDVNTVHAVQHWIRDDGRERFFISAQQENRINKTEVYVDFKPGQPSTEQVYEAVYGIGKECSKRVIIFTNEHFSDEGWNPTVEEMAVRSLVESMNECLLNLYFVKLNGADFATRIYGIEIIEEPGRGRKSCEVPPPIEFRFEEFWAIYFDWHNEGWYEPWKTFDGGFRSMLDWGHMLWAEDVIEIPVYWTESGITYKMKQTNDDDDYLRKIWVLKEEELNLRYQGRVEFEFLPGKLPKMTIQYSDRPVSWLMTATPKERLEFAKQLHADAFDLRWYLSEAMEEAENALSA
jgi:hypothetical protein